jgi:DNA-directed RNA polymerase subunit RPC12/RpoP
MTDTFKCDNCGREFPTDQMKEVFTEGSSDSPTRLCPECLDRRMNQAEEVYGVEGEDKRRAAFVSDSGTEPDDKTFGRRE